jgi:hypothetical protein
MKPFLRCAAVLVASCLVTADLLAASFIRGDANSNGAVDMSDAIKTLNVLFTGATSNDCQDSMDTNDDGAVDISDGVYCLSFLFLGGPAVEPPFPECGPDNTADTIGCNVYPDCVTCFDEAALDALIDSEVSDAYCVPPDSGTETTDYIIVACSAAEAQPCGPPGETGCPIQLSTVEGTLDVPGSAVRIFLVGTVSALPLHVEQKSFPNLKADCSFDITFQGDAVVPLITTPNADGTRTVTDLGLPTLENPDINLSTDDGGLCGFIEGLQDLFVEELVAQLEAAAVGLVEDLKPQVVGTVICPAP